MILTGSRVSWNTAKLNKGTVMSIPNAYYAWVHEDGTPDNEEHGIAIADLEEIVERSQYDKDLEKALIKSANEDTAKRNNEGKIEFSLIPCKAQEEEAKVWMFGKKKYGRDNWKKGGEKLSYMAIIDSMERHINDFKKGITYDAETGIHQAAHIRCNAAMLIEFDKTNKVPDDR